MAPLKRAAGGTATSRVLAASPVPAASTMHASGLEGPSGPMPDPRGVRVSLAPASAGAGLPPIVLEPPAVPVAPAPRLAGRGLLGGMAIPGADAAIAADRDPEHGGEVMLDGRPVQVTLHRLDPERAVLDGPSELGGRERVLLLPPVPAPEGGVVRREVVVNGWRIELEVEPAARAALRERARRGREEAGHSGPTEVHAIIPGVVVSVSVAPGDQVVAGQQLLAVEAMKMQNELRAPRDGTIERVAVAPGRTIEVGDLLLVIT